jgi:sterol desaturase/sphingolipid hydroxylase (fatty acid hydroxylase superfamily)
MSRTSTGGVEEATSPLSARQTITGTVVKLPVSGPATAGRWTFVMANEATFRLLLFGAVLLTVGLWEAAAPRRRLLTSRRQRWPANLSLVAINTVAVRLLLPALPVGMAIMTGERGTGLLQSVTLPFWLKVTLALILLDLIIYLQHLLFHYLPLLWRLHRVHHTDLEIDVTTGNRFHPLEIIISMLIKLAAVALLGTPALAVVIFETVLNAAAQFNHGNVNIPLQLDSWLRLLVVTPDMHRVHHSVIPRETNSNFGFNIPLWDRLFGTYRAQPELGHAGMTIGLKEYRDPAQLTLPRLLIQPFVSNAGRKLPG